MSYESKDEFSTDGANSGSILIRMEIPKDRLYLYFTDF